MSVTTTASQTIRKSAVSAAVDVLITLTIFAAVILGFLTAPLVTVGIAFLGFAASRPYSDKAPQAGRPAVSRQSRYGFGADTR